MVDVAGKPDAPSIDAPDAPTMVVEIAWGAATTSGGVETAGAFEASNDGIVGRSRSCEAACRCSRATPMH